eukprot:2392697-Rhodomonas_salina.1
MLAQRLFQTRRDTGGWVLGQAPVWRDGVRGCGREGAVPRLWLRLGGGAVLDADGVEGRGVMMVRVDRALQS